MKKERQPKLSAALAGQMEMFPSSHHQWADIRDEDEQEQAACRKLSSRGVQSVWRSVSVLFVTPFKPRGEREMERERERDGEREREQKKGREEERQMATSCRTQGTGSCFDFEAFKRRYLATQCALTLKTPVPALYH